ncbi:hypothetical protein GCM10018781_73040 [Kitasatospora indigofera]|uniref:Uncharacterized protein n=1 Tax=Kitasatospora indigofera TaxID=67307 RepID=A0A919L4X6_9ACTN|nr:hypothetical protein GCM10018781_73040 [Kitasatospora indigofera]
MAPSSAGRARSPLKASTRSTADPSPFSTAQPPQEVASTANAAPPASRRAQRRCGTGAAGYGDEGILRMVCVRAAGPGEGTPGSPGRARVRRNAPARAGRPESRDRDETATHLHRYGCPR